MTDPTVHLVIGPVPAITECCHMAILDQRLKGDYATMHPDAVTCTGKDEK